MLPSTIKATPEALFLRAAALVVSGLLTVEQAAVMVGCNPAQFLSALDEADVANAVDAEVTRLQYTGELANLKAATLTDRMLDKLLATPDEDISTSLAMKLAELGLRFKEKVAPEVKANVPKMEMILWYHGDPEPPPPPEGCQRTYIRLPRKPARVVDHEDVTDAE